MDFGQNGQRVVRGFGLLLIIFCCQIILGVSFIHTHVVLPQTSFPLLTSTSTSSLGASHRERNPGISNLLNLQTRPTISVVPSSTARNTKRREEDTTSTYDVDADESSEQLMANGWSGSSAAQGAPIDGECDAESNRRYQQLLCETGLNGQIHSLADLPTTRKVTCDDIFCNRELNLGAVRAIGFDMDYTLAQYHQPLFDKLAFNGAKEKLVYKYGYPKSLLDVEYDHNFWVRGLIIDTQRGNFLKMDRHKYVRIAYHGFSPISSQARKFLYSRDFNKVPSFTEKHYVNMDTLFHFVDASLFATLIDMKDNDEYAILDMKTYNEIYTEIRECVDLCHRDGVIKDEVARNPEKYIIPDEGMIPMLKKFQKDGVKTFLLTNSYWEYTKVAMNFLYYGVNASPEVKDKNEWADLFDLIIVGSCKPAFMVDSNLNLFRVDPDNGSLLNTDGLYEIEALGDDGAQKFLANGKIFQGGNWQHLTAMLEVEAGEEILYVGDHLYSDVLRSKRTLGWRSVFIIPELPEEMDTFYKQKPLQRKISALRKLRDEISMLGDTIRSNEDENDVQVQEKLQKFREDDENIKNVLTELAQEYHSAFHHIWGKIFQAGYQDSRLAYHVQNYACLYTSKATNLGLTSTSRSFRTAGELLPHDKLMNDEYTNFEL